MDERYAAIDVAGKGLVIFSAYVPFRVSFRAGRSVTYVGVRTRGS
jgi:hypothetical protein